MSEVQQLTGGPPKPRRKPRTASRGGSPARSRRSEPGNAGYAGYEYQIAVTVWLGLDLMLVRRATDRIAVEPRTHEDVEATVTDPSAALLAAPISNGLLDLVIQAKTRSGGPWTTTAIADILAGGDGAGKDGRRPRPLEMLEAEASKRYVLVTNAGSVSGLQAHRGEHLFDFPEPDDLPPYARAGRTPNDRAALAKRFLLLDGLTEEVLLGRIDRQLEIHGHIAGARPQCINALRELVRGRIRGEREGIWTKDELERVLVRHGGSIAATRDMDHYVRPASYAAIDRRLRNEHAVIIAGPSGTGKTLTADILEMELRLGNPPFEVVGEERGPGWIRRHLTDPRPILFHLRDPWGGNRLMPEADRWSGELPKLISQAGPGKKFLITSRSDVLKGAGMQVLGELGTYVEYLRTDDYGPTDLARIYDGLASDLGEACRRIAEAHRAEALGGLGRPYEIRRFITELSRQQPDKPSKVGDLVARSQINAISAVVSDQLTALDAKGIHSAALLWSMLVARRVVSEKVLINLAKRLRRSDSDLRPNVQSLIDFMVAGANLRREADLLSFHHPRVEDGMRTALAKRAPEAEHVLGPVLDHLMAWDDGDEDWGPETALEIVRRIDVMGKIDPDMSDAGRRGFDRFLERKVLSIGERLEFDSALRDLARFGSEDSNAASLARVLVDGAGSRRRNGFGQRWSAPVLDESAKARLREHGSTPTLVRRFVAEVLPFSLQEYPEEAADLLHVLVPDLHEAFWQALSVIETSGGPHGNIEMIVAGALSGDHPEFDRAIELFGRAEDEADAGMAEAAQDIYEAEEHAVDAGLCDHIFEECGERYHNGRIGMRAVVRIRRATEGVDFIRGHSREQLLAHALADLLSLPDECASIEEIRLLLDVSKGWVRQPVWLAASNDWHSALAEDLMSEMARAEGESSAFRRDLVMIASRHFDGPLVQHLADAVAPSTQARRLQLLLDVLHSGDELLHQAGNLILHYPQGEREICSAFLSVLAGDDLRAKGAALSPEALDRLPDLIRQAPTEVAGPLAALLATVPGGPDTGGVVDRLMATERIADGEVAIQVALIGDSADLPRQLQAALGHRRFLVRTQALLTLLPRTEASDDRAALAKRVARDRSADVRLAFASAMIELRWPEAIGELCRLLGDERNFSDQLTSTDRGRCFLVARAAAKALGAYNALPSEAIDLLLEAAQASSSDPLVPCRALAALARDEDGRVMDLLRSSLDGPGLRSDPTHRPHPQAAAWAIFDRVNEGITTMLGDVLDRARTEEPAIAAPLLLAAGTLGGVERDALLDRIDLDIQNGSEDARERRSLMVLAALASGRGKGLRLVGVEQRLAVLRDTGRLETLGLDDRESLEGWSRALDVGGALSRYAAWLAHEEFKLPLNGDPVDPRRPDLPDGIQVITGRAQSAFREGFNGED